MIQQTKVKITNKMSQIDNTVKDGFISTQELYEIGVRTGKLTIEELKKRYPNRTEIMQVEKQLRDDETFSQQMKDMKQRTRDNADIIYEKSQAIKNKENAINEVNKKAEEIQETVKKIEREQKIQEEINKRSNEKKE